MSTNIEKLLERLVISNGDKLVINTTEPIYIISEGKKSPVMKQVLNEAQFSQIETEYGTVFKGQVEFIFKNQSIRVEKRGTQLEFLIIGEGSIRPIQPPPSAPPSPPSSRLVQSDLSSAKPNVDRFLRLMPEKRASDVHLSSKSKPMMRIDGDMVILEEFPIIESEDLLDELNRIAPQRNIEEFMEIHDTDFAYAIEGVGRFRVNIFRDIRGVGAVFRIIPSKILTIEDLKVPPAVVNLCSIPKGLILVTGPTGSGKSTTLAALINHLNETQRKHIITIEDPVEFVHLNKLSAVNQREINTHTQSFKKALRAALREDPDIILVGEMRDLETIAIAIEMAVTGHLVFGTLHTSTAIGTVDRIVDQFPSDQQQQIKTMLADALIGVVSQSLLKKKGGGRAAAYEVLVVTPAVSNLIREGKNYQIATLMQTNKALGMQMINTHMLELVANNTVEPAEAIDKAIDKENMKTLLKGKGIQV